MFSALLTHDTIGPGQSIMMRNKMFSGKLCALVTPRFICSVLLLGVHVGRDEITTIRTEKMKVCSHERIVFTLMKTNN